MSIILGIDPGSIVTGFGLISIDKSSNSINYLASGCIRIAHKNWSLRLQQIYQARCLPNIVFCGQFAVTAGPGSDPANGRSSV